MLKKEVRTIATQKNVRGLEDWLQIDFLQTNLEMITTQLGLSLSDFNYSEQGLTYYPFDCCYSLGDVKIYGMDYYSVTDTARYMLVLSGKGCQFYREYASEETLKSLLKTFFNDYGDTLKVTRFDVCIDDFNQKPYYTPSQLLKFCEKKRFHYGKSTTYQTYGNKQQGVTLYLKPAGADDRLRIYDKHMEQAKQLGIRPKDYEFPSWIRYEVEFHREKAHLLAKKYAYDDSDIKELVKGYLKEKLVFYSDDSFQKVAQRWIEFLGQSEPFKLVIKKEKSPLLDKFEWYQFKGSLAIYKAIKFLEENQIYPKSIDTLDEALEKTMFSIELSDELKKYVLLYGREDLLSEITLNTKQRKK
ncbi:replication initiation factor domain-containing protein [Enterococcus plantarum]|uniref:replication initiation factor domain-containing protein n=1 Tax=Enterococcus plantarum TaxID=1077675 RepID=UPI001A906F98